MQGYCWILLCREPEYAHTKDKWIAISTRTQELRNKLEENGVTLSEIGDMISRCRDFMNKPFEDMDIDQQVFFAGVVFV